MNAKSAVYRALPPSLALLFLALVYWETFSRGLVANIDEDPIIFLSGGTRIETVHANSYPTYLLFLKALFASLPSEFYVPVANFSSALFGLAALFFAYLVFRSFGIGRGIASCSILLIGLRPNFWSKCLFVEVYQLSNFLLVSSLASLLWAIRTGKPKALATTAFLCGLQTTHHLLGVPAASLIWLAGLVEAFRRSRIRGGYLYLYLYCLFTCLGLLPYLYLPLVWIAHGEPLWESLDGIFSFLTKQKEVYPDSVGLLGRWRSTSQILFNDFGVVGLVAAFGGMGALVFFDRWKQKFVFMVVLGLGGFLAPTLYLMRFEPWTTLECLSWYLLPIFSLSMFLPFGFEALRRRVTALFGENSKVGRIGNEPICLFLIFLSWLSLEDSYPKLMHTRGDLRCESISKALDTVEPGSTLLNYRSFGRYANWDLIADMKGYSENRLNWKGFTEDVHRQDLKDFSAFQRFRREVVGTKAPYFVLSDSPDSTLQLLREEGKRFQILSRQRFHELPEINLSSEGTLSIRPRNWLEFLTGWVVWELDQGFTSGHLFHNFALRWSYHPTRRISGQLVCGREYASVRYSRQRVFAIEAAFEGGGLFGLERKRLWLDLDPFHMARPMQTWLYKERIGVPVALDTRKQEVAEGRYELTKLSCFPPFDPNVKVTPTEETLIKVFE